MKHRQGSQCVRDVIHAVLPVGPSLPKDADNMNNFATLLEKLFKVWQGRLEVINYSNVSSEPCRLRRASIYNMHVRRRDETTS